MGCFYSCFSTSGRGRRSHTGYATDPEDEGGCTASGLCCCLLCCCIYPCLPCKGGGSYPLPLQELEDFSRSEHILDQDNIRAFHDLQKARIDNKEPIGLTWDDLVEQLHTGDLILFKGSGLGSVLITSFTGRWSHVGMVFTKVIKVENPHGRGTTEQKLILLWESVSHPDECVDIVTNSYKDGVRLVDLRKRLLKCDSPYFGVVRLKIPTSHRAQIQHRFEDFYTREIWKPYEPNKMNLIRVALDCGAMGHNQQETTTYFCSKLVCETLKHMGVIPEETNSARVCPTDFWEYPLRLKRPYRVEALIYMQRLSDESLGYGADAALPTELDKLIDQDHTFRGPLFQSSSAPPIQHSLSTTTAPSDHDQKTGRSKKKTQRDMYKLH